MNTIRMFVNGQAMSGGSINFALEGATFHGGWDTAPGYRFYTVRDEFPGLLPDPASPHHVTGELYELGYEQLRDRLLPNEPPELELTVIKLSDGSGSLCMRMRADSPALPGVKDISEIGSWRTYMSARTAR